MDSTNKNDKLIGKAMCDEFTVLKSLGIGLTAKVKLAKDPKGKLVAIKRYKQGLALDKYIEEEINIMKKLNHPHVVKMYEVRKEAKWTTADGKQFTCFCAIFQYADDGELFLYIAISGYLKPNLSRTNFLQLIDGVKYIHDQGYCHRDLKPQNIMFQSQGYCLKIIDFGFATPLEGEDKSGVLYGKVGTDGYMAPEVRSGKYRGKEIDIFSCGVILFIMYAGSPPFLQSLESDPFYKTIIEKKYDVFWNAHSKKKPINFFTQDFKDLFVKMIAHKPQQRIKAQDILKHTWAKKAILTNQQMTGEVQRRRAVIEEYRQKVKKEKLNQNIKRRATIKQKKQNSEMPTDQECEAFMEHFQREKSRKRTLKIKREDDMQINDYVIHEDSTFFFATLSSFLQSLKQGRNFKIGDDQISIKVIEFQMTEGNVIATFCSDFHNLQEKIQIQIVIEKTTEHDLNLSFNLISGHDFEYNRIVDLIKMEFSPSQVQQKDVSS